MAYSAREILCATQFLARRERVLEDAQAKFAANLASGPAYAVKWAEDALQAEAEVNAARHAVDLLENAEPAEVAAELARLALQRLGWLIPSNSDLAASIYEAQSLARLAREFDAAVRSADLAARDEAGA